MCNSKDMLVASWLRYTNLTVFFTFLTPWFLALFKTPRLFLSSKTSFKKSIESDKSRECELWVCEEVRLGGFRQMLMLKGVKISWVISCVCVQMKELWFMQWLVSVECVFRCCMCILAVRFPSLWTSHHLYTLPLSLQIGLWWASSNKPCRGCIYWWSWDAGTAWNASNHGT